MGSLLGFQLDAWDYATFASMFIVGAGSSPCWCSLWDYPVASQLPATTQTRRQSTSWAGSASSPLSPGYRRSSGP